SSVWRSLCVVRLVPPSGIAAPCFFSCYGDHRVLHSFPTRRSSDLRAALGAYHQPSFYREIRRYDGSINEEIKAQQSAQAVLGFDYSFTGFGRPMRWTTEAYYKQMWDVIPYDIDNVRMRYYRSEEHTSEL